jgi:CRP-like cAMP-binding protein
MKSRFESHLRGVFNSLAPIPDAEWRYFWAHVREGRFARREQLFREGEVGMAIHYIVTGLVRNYHNRDGVELVRGFDFEGRFTAVYETVLTGQPASFSVQALEPTRTLWFSGEVLPVLYDRHPAWDRFGRRILETIWLRGQDRQRRFRVYNAEAHYRLLLERRSPIVARVPLRQLASFLEITPETLSRIRHRIRTESGRPVTEAASKDS